MAAKAQSKHENFLKKTSTAVGYTIIGLDYYIEDYQVTLRQAIMSIRSTTEPDYNLFTAVDDMSYSNCVVFAFRKSFEAEAAAAIPGLPLILEGYYGHKVWTWFSEEAKQETEAFEWDPQQGLIEKQEQIEIDDDYINLAGWEDLDDDNSHTAAKTNTTVHGFEIVPNNLGKNQYHDDGTIKTKHFLANTSSTGTTTTTPTPPDITALLSLLQDPKTSEQVRAALNQQDSTTTEATSITPTKDNSPEAMEVDQE